MIKPIVTQSEKFTILTYNLDTLATLNSIVDQFFGLMKRMASSYEIYKVKKATKIRVDVKNGVKLHVILPAKITNQKVIDSVAVEV